ncbi:peptide transporter family 1-like [Ctenocephalides felis]|uniref:peptide transporter family 1-like n=1 Tax=Ctenocephalides felis TaxID=7515 RepID=UPI000E6E177B|nr:peptide transporter family 1-like [Ctenocephalides felis]
MSSGMVKCVRHALKMWSKERKTNPKEHWLDYSKADFGEQMMDGRIGSYTIIPDHFLLFKPYTCPGFTASYYELYRSVHFKIWYGQVFAKDDIWSYVMYASDIFPRGIVMSPLSIYTAKHIPMHGHKTFNLSSNSPCATFKNKTVFIEEQASVSVFINTDEVKGEVEVSAFIELDKSESGLPHLTVLGAEPGDQILVKDSNAVKIKVLTRSMHTGDIYTANSRPRVVEVTPDEYSLVRKGGRILTQFDMHLGGAYAAILYGDSATFYEIREPNSVHILWLLPQAIIYSIGEIYFMIAWQDFKYTQAPATLKSVVCATAEFCEGIGDAIVVIVTFCATFDQDHEFFLFSGLLIIDMILLVIIGIHFKPQDPTIKLI